MAHILSNGILTVEIAEPGAYSGTRFDWSGFITGVTLEQGDIPFVCRRVWFRDRAAEV